MQPHLSADGVTDRSSLSKGQFFSILYSIGRWAQLSWPRTKNCYGIAVRDFATIAVQDQSIRSAPPKRASSSGRARMSAHSDKADIRWHASGTGKVKLVTMIVGIQNKGCCARVGGH
jgi:hypothetical protein